MVLLALKEPYYLWIFFIFLSIIHAVVSRKIISLFNKGSLSHAGHVLYVLWAITRPQRINTQSKPISFANELQTVYGTHASFLGLLQLDSVDKAPLCLKRTQSITHLRPLRVGLDSIDNAETEIDYRPFFLKKLHFQFLILRQSCKTTLWDVLFLEIQAKTFFYTEPLPGSSFIRTNEKNIDQFQLYATTRFFNTKLYSDLEIFRFQDWQPGARDRLEHTLKKIDPYFERINNRFDLAEAIKQCPKLILPVQYSKKAPNPLKI